MTAKQASANFQISFPFLYKLLDPGEIAFKRRGTQKLPVEESVAEYKRRNFVPAKPVEQPPVTGWDGEDWLGEDGPLDNTRPRSEHQRNAT